MILTEYDEKLHMKNVRTEGYEEGLSTGRKVGREEGIAVGHKQGLTEGRLEEIFDSVYQKDYLPTRGAEKLGVDVETFNKKYEEWLKTKEI